MRLGHVYYDMSGRELDPDTFKRHFAVRVQCGRYVFYGIEVVTEFVGINHNPNPDGDPLIYETLVIDMESDSVIKSYWSYTQAQSKVIHDRTCRFVRFGGALLYHVRQILRCMWVSL